MSTWTWPGSIPTKIIDGDTIDVLVTRDLGFSGKATFPVRLRLNRINCPAFHTTTGAAAAAATAALLPLGAPVYLETVGTYKYGGPDNETGEYMAEITLPDGRNLSDVLVAQGNAVPWNGQGPRPSDGGVA